MSIIIRQAVHRGQPLESGYATSQDHAFCRRIHRVYGPTYYLATQRFPRDIRRRTHALYAFVRVPDEWVDNPGDLSIQGQRIRLQCWRGSMLLGLDGVVPQHPAMRAFCDAIRETNLPVEEPLAFLEAMEQDLTVTRYATYQDLRGYMRGSAVAVGRMMCTVLGSSQESQIDRGGGALAEAMQLTNFLRDIKEDAARGRIYIPQEDLASFGVEESEILAGRVTDRFENLMRFEIARARALYAVADRAIPLLPDHAQTAVRLSRVLYAKILDKIESRNYDVFNVSLRTSKLEKLRITSRVLTGRAL